MRYKLIASGGTFDHFHKGHKEFIRKQLEISEKVLIGLTSNSFAAAKRNTDHIQDYQVRKNVLEKFIKQEKTDVQVEIEPIDTIYIPKKWNNLSIEAIVVTKETKKGADIINQKRKEESLSPLEVFVVEEVLAQDKKPISSRRIRFGEINREGKLYIKPEWTSQTRILPEKIRRILKKPIGILLRPGSVLKGDSSKLITVGDVATYSCNKESVGQKISVVDFFVEREQRYHRIEEIRFSGKEITIRVVNPPGRITADLLKGVIKSLSFLDDPTRIILIVTGEEDLAVLPYILASPLGFVILYGQPGEGIVKVEITEEMKEKAFFLLDSFDIL